MNSSDYTTGGKKFYNDVTSNDQRFKKIYSESNKLEANMDRKKKDKKLPSHLLCMDATFYIMCIKLMQYVTINSIHILCTIIYTMFNTTSKMRK